MSFRKGNADVGFRKWKGIVTEQNIGQFEAEAALDADNVEFLKDGTVQRRKGFELEQGNGVFHTITAAIKDRAAFSHFLWEDINGIPGLSLRLIQVGGVIKITDPSYPLSSAQLLATINLSTFASGNDEDVDEMPCHYAAGAGLLLIAARGIEPIRIIAQGSSFPLALSITAQPVRIRWNKLESGESLDGVGTENLTAEREFDLRNTGWPFRADCSADQDGGSATLIKTDPAAYYRAKIGAWPTPAILFQALKLGTAIEAAALGGFSPWEVDKLHFGNTIPPKGHYVTSAWSFDSRELMGGGTGNVPTPPPLFPVEGTKGQVVAIGDPNFTFTTSLTAIVTGSTIRPGDLLYGSGIENALIQKNTAGVVRVLWTTGANVDGNKYLATGDGRGGFIMALATKQPIKVGDAFELF